MLLTITACICAGFALAMLYNGQNIAAVAAAVIGLILALTGTWDARRKREWR